ncbi:MAG: HPr(Ser) kinase/phosphatase [Clostridia bacterium]|nr:HPr(Ser) kinase/phosphatase [Clostridia bacterium]MBQ5802511.1 HPr(Ser) kinase/phosphatase [Clostridia bacterium]
MSAISERVSVTDFAEKNGLKIIYEGRGYVELSDISVSRPGLQLAGFFKNFAAKRVQLIGNAEYDYLANLKKEKRCEACRKFLRTEGIPCLIFTNNLIPFEEVLEVAKEYNVPVLSGTKISSLLMNDLIVYLNRLLAPTTSIHGVLVDVYGVGILLTGHSGIGKSETALELIKRGHRLVADDAVYIKEINDVLIGTSNDLIRYFMELRGIGIINVKNMYGTGAVLPEKEIELVMELENWDEGKMYDRLGDGELSEEILDVKIPKLVIPVHPGRNLAVIIEVAARNHRLKKMGYDAAKELISRTIGQ